MITVSDVTSLSPVFHQLCVLGNIPYYLLQRWTRQLCLDDSDGDGRSNGLELCDPECNWSPGQAVPSCTGIASSVPLPSHPGICEPLSECMGKNQFEVCPTLNTPNHNNGHGDHNMHNNAGEPECPDMKVSYDYVKATSSPLYRPRLRYPFWAVLKIQYYTVLAP